jgi:chromosome partitioning protein
VKTRIISILQLKGGVGRSTVATNLAGELSRGKPVALIDCDAPQDTSLAWYYARQKNKPSDNLKAYSAKTADEMIQAISQLDGQVKYIILDSPPRISEIARAMLMASDLILIPIGASLAEVWACSDLNSDIKDARQHKELNAHLLWTRYREYTNLAKELHDKAEEYLELPSLNSILGYRVAYAEALGSGHTVGELKDDAARREIVSLVVEVKKLLKGDGAHE